MITQQLIQQTTGQQDNNRVYKLDLCSRAITRISSLKTFPKIRYLNLGFNRIRSIENLEQLSDLRELHLDFNQIQKIERLEANKMLTVLSIMSNRIQRIQGIGHLIKLETLVLDNNKIEKLSGLETLKDLKFLSVNGNKLVSIQSLPAFSKLQSLNAQSNQISKISQNLFSKSTKLIKLNLSHNLLQQVTFMPILSSLQQLNLSHNNISQLPNSSLLTFPLKNLQYLNLNNNKLTKLPKISQSFPELSIFLFANNEINNEFQLIQSFADAEMLVQVDYRGNYMDVEGSEFMETLYKVYNFDRINQKNFNKPGTRYNNQAQEINKQLRDEQGSLGEIQGDQEARKIIMSGFYNAQLQMAMTGVKPQRPNSPIRNKNGATLNFEDMQKSYKEIVKNEKRLQYLRNTCMNIFKQNGITLNLLTPKQQQKLQQQNQQKQIKQQQNDHESKKTMITQLRNLTDKTTSSINKNSVSQLMSKNQDNASKWKQLKNRQKNFNIRGVVRKMSGSQKNTGGVKEGSLSKISTPQERSQLMKTQLNPPRLNGDINLMRTTLQPRAFSAKKK